MSLLQQRAPTAVTIHGVAYAINSDYRVSIQFEQLVLSGASPADIALQGLQLYFSVLPHDLAKACEAIDWFFRCGREESQRKATSTTAKRIYDYEIDAHHIYASFLEQYGIDLEVADLHWWKFRSMFEALSEDTAMGRVMSYRGADISKLSGEQKAFYRKMQTQYALAATQVDSERIQTVADALIDGGDIAALLKW